MLRGIILPDGRQQILQEVPPYRMECLDLRGQEPVNAAAQLEAVREKLSHKIHRTDVWPLFDFCATHIDERRTRLHVGLDLLIADGRSFEIDFGELSQLYRNPGVELPPLELSFRDYLIALNSIDHTRHVSDIAGILGEPLVDAASVAGVAAGGEPGERRHSRSSSATMLRSIRVPGKA